MEITHNRIDVAASLANVRPEVPPAFRVQDVIRKQPGELWLVSHDALYMDRPIQWFHCRSGEHVMIPLVPYLTLGEPDLAMAFMFQLGVRCGFDIGRPVRRLHLATGYPVDQVFDEASGRTRLRYYLGFAVLLERTA